MTVVPAMRVNYFERQFLRLAEFRDEQAYHIALRRRHNLSHHSWGIVTGLAIVLDQGIPVVEPGLAVDGYGRELLLIDRITIDRATFDRYGTTRLDVWLEYELGAADADAPPGECDPASPNQQYRAVESATVVSERASAADVDARSPRVVPADVLAETLPDTTDDPTQRWPVYLGRLVMTFGDDGKPMFTIAQTALAYIGLNAELIDHPATPARIEIGHTSIANATADTRTIADVTYTYEPETGRQFAVFVPPTAPTISGASLQPTIAVTKDSTQIRGTTDVHGDLVLDGSTLLFPSSVDETLVSVDDGPAIYRTTSATDGADELRIDLGDAGTAVRNLVIGLTKDGQFQSVLEVNVPLTGTPPQITVHGDLHVQGTFSGPDIRLRTLSQDLIPQLAAMLQVGVLSGTT
jgi:hypothetical protein